MNKSAISLIIWSIVLVIAQATIFNHICLFGVAVPFVFLYTILKLPLTLSREWLFTIAFVLGLIVDIFSDTPGMYALACTITAALRQPIIKLYINRDEEIADPYPGIKTFGLFTFSKYSISISLLFCTIVFLVQALFILNPLKLIMEIVASTLLTTILLVAIDSITVKKSEKRL